jgi:alkylhydroperoxidase family enzyme
VLLRSADWVAKLDALERWREDGAFDERERALLEYAEAVTLSDRDVDDALYARVAAHLDESGLVELTGWICLENFLSKFNRSFRVESQGFCRVREAR